MVDFQREAWWVIHLVIEERLYAPPALDTVKRCAEPAFYPSTKNKLPNHWQTEQSALFFEQWKAETLIRL